MVKRLPIGKRIHYTGIPCKADIRAGGRWDSRTMSCCSDPQKVTCRGCLKVMAKQEGTR